MKKGLELGRGKYARKNFPGWNRKAVVYVDEDGISHVYSSGASAGRAHHLSGRNIRSVCSGLRKTCGGKVWYWYDDKRWMSLCKC